MELLAQLSGRVLIELCRIEMIPASRPRSPVRVLIELCRIEMETGYFEYAGLTNVLIELCRIEIRTGRTPSGRAASFNRTL